MKYQIARLTFLYLINVIFSCQLHGAEKTYRALVLGTKYVINEDLAPKLRLVGQLQEIFDSKIKSPKIEFINGGVNGDSTYEITDRAIEQIASKKPDFTILISGLSYEVLNDSFSNLDFISKMCPYIQARLANPKNADLFLNNYMDSIQKIKSATEKFNGKFYNIFLGAKIRKEDLIKRLGACSFIKKLPNIGLNTDNFLTVFRKNKINTIYSSFFTKILIENGGLSPQGAFSKEGNKLLAEHISFWLFPELIK